MKSTAAVASAAAILTLFAGTANAVEDYAEVLAATPVYRQVQVLAPQQQCYQQRVVYDDGAADTALGTVLGGVAGGVLGNQVGGGSGRALATVAGAVIGIAAGHQIAAAGAAPATEGYQQRCTTVNAYRTESRLDGYDVTYRYYGRIFRTHLAEDPGPRMPVQVDVRPNLY